MLASIVVSELSSLVAEVLLHERIYNDLFSDGMPRDLPSELSGPARLRIYVAALPSAFVLVMVLVHLGVCIQSWPPELMTVLALTSS